MATKYRVQNSFAAGELSPKMHGRYDTEIYKQGTKTMKNFVPLLQGPAKRRPGTYYAADATTNTSDGSRLIPFYFGEEDSYVLEFSNGKIRFFSQNGQLMTATNAANPYEKTSTGITEAQTKTFDFTQSADVIYIVHPDFKPKQLARTIEATNALRAADNSVWTLTEVDFTDGPWDDVNTDNTKLVKVTAVTSSDYAWADVDGVGVDTTANRFTLFGHGLMNGMKIRFPSGTGLTAGNLVTADSSSSSETPFPSCTTNTDPSSLDGTEYYIVNAQASSFQIASDAGGSPLEFKLSKLNNLRIDSVTIQNGGSGYSAGSLTAESSTGGSAFAATYTVSGGAINAINITNNGRNYGNATIKISDTAGTGAVLIPVIGDASVVEWTGKLDLQKKVIAKDKDCTITASGHTFDADDDERLIRVNVFAGSEAEKTKGIRWTWFKVTAVASGGASLTATSQGEVGIVDVNTREWRMGILGGDNKWPSCVQIHQQRLVVGSSTQYPTTVWLSESGDFHSFAPDSKIGISTGAADSIGQTIMGEQILDSNAISLTIDSDTVDEIYWIAEGKKLALGTSGGVFNLYGSENNYTITPTNFSIIRDTSWEAADIKPVRIGNAMVYVQFNKRKLRVLTFSGEDVQYESREISYQADELVGKEVKEIVYQKQPHSLTWCRFDDGTLATLSFEDTIEVVGWGRHEIAGVNGTETAGVWSVQHGEVESMAVIPYDGRDQLWMIIRRNINGSNVRYVEYLEKFYEPTETTQDLAHFVDCGLEKQAATAFTTANFLHLKGEELRILGDGAIQPNATVNSTSGVLTINASVKKLIAGLPYNSELVCLTPKQAVDGSLFVVGRDRVVKAHMLLHDTLGVKIGLSSQSTSDLEEIIFRLTQDDLNTMVPLFTGNKTANILSRSLDEEQIKIVCDQPFPMTLVALVSEHEMNV